MNIHKNARLTPPARLPLVRRVDEAGWPMAEAAQAAGFHGGKGIAGWLATMPAARRRCVTPGCCKHRIGAERIAEITELRGQRLSGPAIARKLALPVSTVGAILREPIKNASAESRSVSVSWVF